METKVVEYGFRVNGDSDLKVVVMDNGPDWQTSDLISSDIWGRRIKPAGAPFILEGKHKGFNIAQFLNYQGWRKDDCIYIGDALFPGGNDAAVIGVIPTHAVKDDVETFEFIKSQLLSAQH